MSASYVCGMKTLEFDISHPNQSEAFALLCMNLHKAGVPYHLDWEPGITCVALTISDGY